MIGNLARRVLGGKSPKEISVVKVGTNLYIFNWLGMEKYGVSKDALPEDSIIINEPYSFYQGNLALIWGGIAVLIVLSLLVLMLSRTVFTLRRARKELSYSERNYKSIFDNAMEGIFQLSQEGKFLALNKACATLHGYDTPEECVAAIKGPEDVYANMSDFEEINKTLQQEGRVSDVEVQVKHKDGSFRWVNFNIRKTFGPNGDTILEGAIIDITERKNAEMELRRMRKYLSNVLDSMPSILVGVDREGHVNLLNKTAEEYAGVTSENAFGRNLTEIFPWLEPFAEMIQQSIHEQVPRYASKVMRHDKGKTHYEDITIFPLSPDVSKEAVVRVDNVSRSVQMEKMMLQSEKMMSLGGLAAGMAHEINNPLAAVIGFTHNIKKRISPESNKNKRVAEECGMTIEALNSYLEKRDITTMISGISESGERAANIVSNMLDFSRKSEPSGAGRHKVADLLHQAIGLASNVYDMQKQFDFRSITVTREYADDLPEVLCDGNEMQQVFLNLLKNGVEAMAEKDYGEEKPTFILRTYQKDSMVITEIEDNGPGMPEHIRRRILEPFFTTKPVGKGTGLGLSVSYFIVTDLCKGCMEVQSEEGNWTRFTIGLPIADKS